LLVGSVIAANDDYATHSPAIPPGEERLIATMLGRSTLVRGCRLISGGVQYTVINATYECPRGPVTLELTHVLNATEASIQTGHFAITVLSGSPPPDFQEALLSRIRSRERAFVWIWQEHVALEDDAGDAAE
jgi:hypothetical protein